MVDSKHIEKSENLITWLVSFIDHLSIPPNDRIRIAATCLDAAMEHHRSIVLTTTASYYGSAFALLRIEFEAYIRGAWLSNCASDNEVERFNENGKLNKTVGSMIDDLEGQEAFNVGVLSDIKHRSWKEMCDFTHTGRLQVVRRLTSTEIAPNYPEEEIIDVLEFAGCVALWSVQAILNMATGELTDREELSIQLLNRLKKFVGNT